MKVDTKMKNHDHMCFNLAMFEFLRRISCSGVDRDNEQFRFVWDADKE